MEPTVSYLEPAKNQFCGTADLILRGIEAKV